MTNYKKTRDCTDILGSRGSNGEKKGTSHNYLFEIIIIKKVKYLNSDFLTNLF